MGTVNNLVCPSCARTNGKAHAPGCPRDTPDATTAYIAGWDAAHAAFGDLARWAKDDERKILSETLRAYADVLDGKR